MSASLGLARGTSVLPVHVFDGGYYPSIGLTQGGDVLDFYEPQAVIYDLKTSLGPIPGSLEYHAPFATTLGNIDITSLSSGTFTATLNPVPEASTTVSFSLLPTMGLGGVFFAEKRKRQA